MQFNNTGKIRDMKEEDQQKALNMVLSTIDKQHGKGAVFTLKDKEFEPCEAISTSSMGVDIATGVGGLPLGRMVEIFGPESSGKTSICLHVIANAQKRGGVCAFIDTEHALDLSYARSLGVNTEKMIFSQPDFGEQALDIVEALARSGSVDVIVIDSVAALVPKAEIEGDMGQSYMGLQARLMSQACRKLAGVTHKTNTLIIWTNQIRSKIGIAYGNPEVTTGGNALKFYASMRLDIRRIGQLKGANDEDVRGNRTKVKIVKNKLAPPFREAEFDIIFGKGIDYLGEVFDLAIANKVIGRAGSWYSYGETRLGQGAPMVKNLLNANPEMLKEVLEKIDIALLAGPQQTEEAHDEKV